MLPSPDWRVEGLITICIVNTLAHTLIWRKFYYFLENNLHVGIM